MVPIGLIVVVTGQYFAGAVLNLELGNDVLVRRCRADGLAATSAGVRNDADARIRKRVPLVVIDRDPERVRPRVGVVVFALTVLSISVAVATVPVAGIGIPTVVTAIGIAVTGLSVGITISPGIATAVAAVGRVVIATVTITIGIPGRSALVLCRIGGGTLAIILGIGTPVSRIGAGIAGDSVTTIVSVPTASVPTLGPGSVITDAGAITVVGLCPGIGLLYILSLARILRLVLLLISGWPIGVPPSAPQRIEHVLVGKHRATRRRTSSSRG